MVLCAMRKCSPDLLLREAWGTADAGRQRRSRVYVRTAPKSQEARTALTNLAGGRASLCEAPLQRANRP